MILAIISFILKLMPFNIEERGFVNLFIVLIILFVIVSGIGVVYFLGSNKSISTSSNLSSPPPKLPVKAVTVTSPPSIPPANSMELSQGQLTQNQTQGTQDSQRQKRDLKCTEQIDFWQYLPENLKDKTYKDGIISPGQSTYDIFPLAWSKNCQWQAFLLELVGRDADAYTSNDFQPRGVYIFDNDTKKIKLAYSMPTDFTLDEEAYESNFWFAEDKYIFVVTTKKTKKEFISRRYEYDVTLDKVEPSGE